MKWKKFKKQNSFMQTRLHKQNICKEMHQDHYFLLIEIMITCEFLLCFFFCLFTTIVLKPMTVCTFLSLLLKSIMLLPLGPLPAILSLTKHKLRRCLLRLPVSGLCLPENVLFNCFGIILM